MTKTRSRVYELSQQYYQQGDYTGWFEKLYAEAAGNTDAIPWADRGLNYWLSDWIEQSQLVLQDRRVLVVGCGLGDDAEYLAQLGARVTAFDLSQTAIDWCHQRFPDSQVNYQTVDLFAAPADWKLSFDLVIEIYTIQALPGNIRPNTIDCIGNFVAPNGKLLVVCRGCNPEDPRENLPFPLTQSELNRFIITGLTQVSFEDFIDTLESGSPRRFRVVYQRLENTIELSQWLTGVGNRWNGDLAKLQELDLSCRKLSSLPESIGQLTNLQKLYLGYNELTSLPESIGQLTNLQELYLNNNKLTSLPESIGQLTNLRRLDLNDNQLNDLSPLQRLAGQVWVQYLNIFGLHSRYWKKFSDWDPQWLPDEKNAEIRSILIQQMGYEKICDRLGAKEIDAWREYTLLKFQMNIIHGDAYEGGTQVVEMVLLKMICPSTKHIHILRVPPEMTSAEAAITWINHGIHPDEIAVQTE